MSANLFKRELKVNGKAFLLWVLITGGLYFVTLVIYPQIVQGNEINEMMTMFPPELLQAMNMDLASIATAAGWLASEGLLFYLLLGAIYSCILGGTILLKEENDHTIDFLYGKPLSKTQILTSKLLCGALYVVGFTLVVGLACMAALAIVGDFDCGKMALLLFCPVMIFLSCYCLMFFLSTFLRRTKHTMVISFGVAFGFYFFTLVSSIGEQVNWVKYFSLYTLSDTRYILEHGALNPWAILVFVVLSAGLVAGAYWRYQRKQFLN